MSDASAYLPSVLGLLELRGTEAGLHSVRFLPAADPDCGSVPATVPAQVAGCLRESYRQLQAYFGRELREFSVATHVTAGTDFQRQVWAALPAVGYGTTASYLELARQLGNPGAVRAVGAANGHNPLAIIWPCHRIIGAGGQLTGYAGGLARKKWLLELERPHVQTSLF
ncbi:methylated-DNA--[protein]-cysteine S-methyltransferase [Hymenobacter rubripertinctus]|uniref:Methylated-DNA--protein-cysteine methyltransferase n=1 Tax=Hymenobacter rubripertinctus TaxID=2029981 RepID=A0A418R672_9BACT|nr:methylated-DNA--[protein]-cysteine S-methyltransferase [Hymenobacter rubripertinctus]RIY12967.1 methylated-DNA--[protein]-cysteine S-methyltransferase [Hymenobacter rubripertinctus]